MYTIKEQLTTKRNVNTPSKVTYSSEQTDADCLIRMKRLLYNVLCKEHNSVRLERARTFIKVCSQCRPGSLIRAIPQNSLLNILKVSHNGTMKVQVSQSRNRIT